MAAIVVAMLATLALPADAQQVETSVERTVFIGDNVAPLAPVVEGSAMSVIQRDGELPAGISLAPNGSFAGAVTAAGESAAVFELTDLATEAQELRSVIFVAAPKPVVEVSIDLAAEVRVEVFAFVVNAEESVAELVGGELPPGIEFVGRQFVQGIPTKGGVFVSQFAVTNEVFGGNESVTLTIKVGDTVIREELAQARAQLQDAKTELQAQKDKLSDVKTALAETNAEVTALRAKRSEATTREERVAINAEIVDARARRTNLIADRNEVKAAMADSRETITALRTEVADLKAALG